MTEVEWRKLMVIGPLVQANPEKAEVELRLHTQRLIEKTRREERHPEFFTGPCCQCAQCCIP